jgi:hypothetical protein
MNTLPVRVANWQIGCCGDEHVATIGNSWAEVMLLVPLTLGRSTTHRKGWTHDGQQIEFVGTIVAPGPGVIEIDLGTIRLGLESWPAHLDRWPLLSGDAVSGSGFVQADWHTMFHPDFDDEVTVEGVVRKISTVKAILGPMGEVVGHERPVEIDRWPPRFSPDVIVELEIAAG